MAANLVLTPSEFADLVLSFIFDKMVNPDEIVVDNEDFSDIIKKMSKMGAQPLLLKYYLNLSADQRLNYKRIKNSLEIDATAQSQIRIKPEKHVPESKLKNLAKKVVRKLLKKESLNHEEIELVQSLITEVLE